MLIEETRVWALHRDQSTERRQALVRRHSPRQLVCWARMASRSTLTGAGWICAAALQAPRSGPPGSRRGVSGDEHRCHHTPPEIADLPNTHTFKYKTVLLAIYNHGNWHILERAFLTGTVSFEAIEKQPVIGSLYLNETSLKAENCPKFTEYFSQKALTMASPSLVRSVATRCRFVLWWGKRSDSGCGAAAT